MGTWYRSSKKYVLNHDIDNMDVLLQGILVSRHPDHLKRQLIEKIANKGQLSQPINVIHSVLELSVNWFLDGETELSVSSGFQVFTTWAKHNISTFDKFFTRDFLLSLLSSRYRNEANAPILLQESLRLLQRRSSFLNHAKVIEAKAINYVQEHMDLGCLRNFVILLLEFKECVPKGDFTYRLCVAIIHNLSFFSVPEENHVLQFVKDANTVAEFLHRIWSNTDLSTIMECLRTIFTLISSTEEMEPSSCLGAVVRFVPSDLASMVVKNAISDPNIDDDSMLLALLRMIDWLAWPTARNVDQWVTTFLKELAAAKKYPILISVTENKVEQVTQRLYYPLLREASFSILSHMLLSFQHSPDCFHKILPIVPSIISVLQGERTPESENLLSQMVELLHCLMHQHAGFPDLYDPLLEIIKDYPVPTSEIIRAKLDEGHWDGQCSRHVSSSVGLPEKSETGKTGLSNLGNSCYMNSVLQALFMIDQFRRGVLQHNPSTEESLIVQLQQVFAFLTLSQRPAYAPVKFLEESRPPWFTAGFQQDCSEFLKFLLDRLHEQERGAGMKQLNGISQTDSLKNNKKSVKAGNKKKDGDKVCDSSAPPTLVQRTFGGKMCTTVKCLNCKTESTRTECFTDIPLAFPEYHLPSHKSLAGGNSRDSQSDKECSEDKEPVVAPTGSSLHLSNLIDHYLQPEKMTGDNKYHCDKCRGLQEGERRIRITQSPEYLILTLLRFSYDTKLQTRAKIFKEVKYPKTLILPVDKSCGDKETCASHTQNKRQRTLPSNIEKKLCIGANDSLVDRDVYGLCNVIVHSGTSSECGHYYCYSRHSLLANLDCVCDGVKNCSGKDDVDFLQEKWYLFNDSRVSYANYSSFSNVTKRFMKDTAYVLVYRKIDLDSVDNRGVDLNDTIHPVVVDPPLKQDLKNAVAKDNAAYVQEQENAERLKAERRQHSSSTSSAAFYDWHDSDGDQGPPGSCGGGGGGGGLGDLDTSGARFVF